MSENQKNKENNNEILDKVKYIINSFVDRIRDDRKFAYGVCGGVLAVILIIVLVAVFTGGDLQNSEDEGQPANAEVDVNLGDAADPENIAEGNTGADDSTAADGDTESKEITTETVNQMVIQYFDALASGDVETIKKIKNKHDEKELLTIQKKSEYIEKFENLNTYSKAGPVADSFVVFAYYEIKFANIDTLAPGLITLYMCPKDDNGLIIYDGQLSEELEPSVVSYIREIAVTDEIAELFERAKVKYNEAVDGDAVLKAFMEGLAEQLENEVEQVMAQTQQPQETENEEPVEEAPTVTQTNDTVKAKETVNVRSSDSENADKLGKLDGGTTVKRYESRENGWSKIDYNGQEGFVKSEYIEAASDAETTNESTESTTQEAATPNTNGDKVRVKETVRIRKSANTNGDVLATAFPGEEFELVMVQADGWTKIKYKGETAFIKSEYLE